MIVKTAKNNTLYLDVYEVKTKPEALDKDEQQQISNLLYECQCALFLIDITSTDSFESVKYVIKEIDNAKNPYLTKIVISNKTDLEANRAVSGFELKEYFDGDSTIQSLELNLKADDGFQELLEKIYDSLHDENKKIPSNVVTECISHQKSVTSSLISLGSLRVVLLGDSSVGKTAFLNRYFKNTFNENFLSTIGIDDETTFIKVNNDLYKLTVWDTAGQERFRALPKKYYQNADGILLLFDVTNQESFDNIKTWMKDISENTNKTSTGSGIDSSLTIYLLGNKVDMKEKRVISRQKAESEAVSFGMKYFEISCKLNLNIPEVMNNIILDCFKQTTGIHDVFQLKTKKQGQSEKSGGDCCGGKKKTNK